jgi:hypothetical protein
MQGRIDTITGHAADVGFSLYSELGNSTDASFQRNEGGGPESFTRQYGLRLATPTSTTNSAHSLAVQDAENGDAGLHQELPVAIEKTARVRRPFGFPKHQASLIVARSDIAHQLTGCLEMRENPQRCGSEFRLNSRRQVVF